MHHFFTECSQIRAVSDNPSILSPENIEYSSHTSAVGQRVISRGWCGTDNSPHFIANFTEPVHLLYALASGVSIYFLTSFSYIFENRSSAMIHYMNVDGEMV